MRILIIAASIALGGCGGEESKIASNSAVSAPAASSAEDVVGAFRRAGLNITDVEVLTAETDGNKLLGRPNQYTSKLFFYDARHPKAGEGDEGENTIEVFASAEDAKRRHDYIAEMTAAIPMLTQYQLLHGTVLVRFDKAMLPAEVEEYRLVLKAPRAVSQ